MEYDLNAPAFGPGSQTPDQTAIATPEADVEEVVEQSEEVQTEESVEESKVPYSRFKKFHDEAKYYQQQAEEWRQRAEASLSQPIQQTRDEEVPNYWVKLYGDSPESVEAWKIQREQNERIKAEAREEAIRAVKEQSYQEEIAVEQNLEVIDSNLESLADYIGRPLTVKEETAILDIIDDYTPKDRQGNYLGETIPFEKAWEIYELKQLAKKAPRTEARNEVASLTSTRSEGGVGDLEKDKSFNPLDWNAWKKRI